MTWSSVLTLAAAHASVLDRDLLDTTDLQWQTVHDTVMGGRSSGTVEETEAGLRFTGSLSLENNGGFASIRGLSEDFDLSGTGGLQLELVGDGRSWQVTVDRSDVRLRAGSYRAVIDTEAGVSTVHTLLWSDFQATSFGRPVIGVPGLETAPARITRVGLMVADGNPGTFDVEVRSLRPLEASEEPEPEPEPEVSGDSGNLARTFARAIELGVPAYNSGDAGRCRAHYQTAIESVLLMGGAGLPLVEVERLQAALSRAKRQSDSDAAWTLRRAMDGVLMASR